MDVIVNIVTKIQHIIMKRALPSIKMIKDRPLKKGSDFDTYMLQGECLLHVYSCTYRVQAQFHEHGLQTAEIYTKLCEWHHWKANYLRLLCKELHDYLSY